MGGEAPAEPTVGARMPCLALLVLAGSVVAYLLTAPAFRVGEPRVVGQSLVAAEAIGLASGVGGQSIFLVDPDRVERAVVDLRPIQSAAVRLAWPNSVTIEVVERRPFATWRSGGRAFLVCAEGIVLAESQGVPPPLTIEDKDARRLIVGGRVDPAVLAQAGALRDGLRPYQPGGAIFEYSRSEGLAATLALPGPSGKVLRVVFGQGGDVSQKLAVWDRLAAEIGAAKLKAEVVDLRIADRPFVR